MRIVAVEEHFVVPELLDAWSRLGDAERDAAVGFGDDPLARRLRDVADGRIADMDDQGIDVQVLSLNSPGVQNLPPADAVAVAREADDALAQIVAARPDRFQAFAALPTPDPAAAAAELERAVTLLGFSGGLLNGRTGDRNADHPAFDDLWATAARLHVPVSLHPQLPVAPVRQAYYSGLGGDTDLWFAMAGVGWHYETGVQLLRMILAGVFDRHPDLQIVLGHWGELVLFFLDRIDPMLSPRSGLQRPIREVFRENVWITGSGILSERYLRWATEVVGTERLLYATDYPFVDTFGGKARTFLAHAPMDEAAKAMVAEGNWARLTGGR